MKTIRQHIQEFPNPYRAQAMINSRKEYLETKEANPLSALAGAFDWVKTPEGLDYWLEFAGSLLSHLRNIDHKVN